ncbi:MAG: DUF1127 domain-containing protein [Pseudomonadota bacterium]
MAVISTNTLGFAGIPSTVANMIADFRARAQRRAVYNETVRQLGRLSREELEDLGLTRYSIEEAAAAAVYGK